jgi:sec-independent protein translocase protein TatC
MKRLTGFSFRDSEPKPFLEHLEDLRTMLIRCAIALSIGTGIALPFAPQIFALLKAPLDQSVDRPDLFLQSLEITGAFSVSMRIALWGGLLISAPFLVFFIGQFVFPGLTEKERLVIRKAGGFSVVLFVVGVLLAYKGTLPVALNMMFGLHDWLGIQPMPQVTSYVGFTVHLLLAFGVAFQMPVVLVILGKLGIVTAAQLRERRRYVVVILLVVAMFLTPPDVFTQLVMALPLILLYEVCIHVVALSERRDARRQRDA